MCLDKRYTEIWIMMNLPVPCPHYPHYLPVQIFTRSEKKIFARSYCGQWRGLNILLMLLGGTRNLIRYINKTYISLEEDHLLSVLSRFASNTLFTTLASCCAGPVRIQIYYGPVWPGILNEPVLWVTRIETFVSTLKLLKSISTVDTFNLAI